MDGKRFIVIPSASTYLEPIWDVDQGRHELIRNFMLLVRDEDYAIANWYLEKSCFNLPNAIENYYFDIC